METKNEKNIDMNQPEKSGSVSLIGYLLVLVGLGVLITALYYVIKWFQG